MLIIILQYNFYLWICTKKKCSEQEQYKANSLTLPPAQILDHAGEYACRENTLMVIESNNLNNARAEALLKFSTPLDNVYKKWAGWEPNGEQKENWNAVQALSGEVLRDEFAVARRLER